MTISYRKGSNNGHSRAYRRKHERKIASVIDGYLTGEIDKKAAVKRFSKMPDCVEMKLAKVGYESGQLNTTVHNCETLIRFLQTLKKRRLSRKQPLSKNTEKNFSNVRKIWSFVSQSRYGRKRRGHSGHSLRCFDNKSLIRRMYQNKFIIVLTVLSTSFFVKCQQGSGNTASGNAMDLAFMNMNMMGHNSNCDIQPCQTVCQVLNTTSGCYVCSTSCTAGTGTGLNAPLNPPGQIPIGGVTGCEPNWMQCPISCVRKYNLGCVTCDCGADTQKIPTTSVLLSTPQSKTDTKSRLQSSQFTKDLSTGTETIAPTTRAISSTVLASLTSRMPDTNYTQQQIQQILSLTTQPSGTKTSTVMKLPSTTDIRFSRNSTTRTEAFSYANLEDLRKESSINSGSDSNDCRIVVIVLVFLLSTFFVISVTLLVVLLIVWRRSSRELKRNKNELYFVHKAYRQDSKAQLQNNEFDMDEQVYALADKPEVPPRSLSLPSLFPTVISTELKASVSSQTNEKSVYQSDDVRHDYLELI